MKNTKSPVRQFSLLVAFTSAVVMLCTSENALAEGLVATCTSSTANMRLSVYKDVSSYYEITWGPLNATNCIEAWCGEDEFFSAKEDGHLLEMNRGHVTLGIGSKASLRLDKEKKTAVYSWHNGISIDLIPFPLPGPTSGPNPRGRGKLQFDNCEISD